MLACLMALAVGWQGAAMADGWDDLLPKVPVPTAIPASTPDSAPASSPVGFSSRLVLRGWDGASYQYVQLGNYVSGGRKPEPILWRVLYTTDNRALLLSEYILATRPFDSSRSIWDGSRIKEWLNGTFLRNAFSAKEDYDALVDDWELGRVFLLSREEMANESYGFSRKESSPDSQRQARGTSNAIFEGLWGADTGYSSYFTRTAKGRTSVYQIRSDGCFGEARINRDNVGTRPAIWIFLDKVSFSSGDGTMESPYR